MICVTIRRLWCCALATMVPLMCLAGTARAGLLVSSASGCSAETLSQPFTPWLDDSQYTLVPGGSFEAGQPSWSLSGGAATVAGNESFYANSSSDSQSLALPGGSSATSPAMCVGIENPTLRLFARNTGAVWSTLQVNVLFTDSLGQQLTAPIETLTAGAAWEPTAIAPILANVLTLFPGQKTNVAFQFTAQGAGDWQIDDVYVDPIARGG